MLKKAIKQIKNGLQKPTVIDWALVILKANIKESDFLFIHSVRAALILKESGAGEETLASALMHHISLDKIEPKEIPEKTFKETMLILKTLKKLRGVFNLKKELKKTPIKNWRQVVLNSQAENLSKMFFALSQDLRPVFLMLAVVLDEMRHLRHFPHQERPRKSLEALEIFSPLAYSLGAMKIKGELEDLAFPYLYFKEYAWLIKHLKERYEVIEAMAQEMQPILSEQLKKAEVPFLAIAARGKHYFSLYQKLLRHNMDLDKIYDLVALRIIVRDIGDCFRALGAIHKSFPPLEGRIKDYISLPKRNGYRALHTTVFCQKCNRFIEIQIKTKEMDKEAEYGAWAHLNYKGKRPEGEKPQFYWMNILRQQREEVKNEPINPKVLGKEIFKDKIFVFTPKREIIELPLGSTAVDFAYAVHSDIGEHCQGAKVNSKIAPLSKTLKMGEVVEIITSPKKLPSSDWLRFVKTSKAKNKIKAFLEDKKGLIFNAPAVKEEAQPDKKQKSPLKQTISFLGRMIPPWKKKGPKIYIAGQTGIQVKISKCCQPKAGDNVRAFITKGQGAALHKIGCLNLKQEEEKWPQRIVEATWGND